MEFVAIDFETASRRFDSACALAIVRVRDGVVVERHSWLFRPPGNRFSSSCINVHGITPDMTTALDDFSAIYEPVFRMIDGAVVVAHNSSFDMAVLRESLAHYGLPVPVPQRVHCTCRMSGNRKLSVCCAERGIPLDHHDPLSDALACARLFLDMQGIPYLADRRGSGRPFEFNDPARRLPREARIPADLAAIENKETDFYGKRVVITGTLARFPLREQLALLLRDYGAEIQTAVSSRTDIVICGRGAGPAKLRKISELNEKGGGIRLFSEHDLYRYLDSLPPADSGERRANGSTEPVKQPAAPAGFPSHSPEFADSPDFPYPAEES